MKASNMAYVDDVLAFHRRRDFNEAEFLQALDEVLNSIRPVIEEKEETYRNVALLERLLSETPSKKERPKLLVLHASDRETSNTLALGELVAQQLLGGLCLNKAFRLPPRFCLIKTARIMQTERRMIL